MIDRNFLLFCKYYGITYLYCRRFLIEYSFVNVSFFFSVFKILYYGKNKTKYEGILHQCTSRLTISSSFRPSWRTVFLHYTQTSANNVSVLDKLLAFSICNFSTSSQSNLLYEMNNFIESNFTNNYNTIFESITYVIINKTNLKQSSFIYMHEQ